MTDLEKSVFNTIRYFDLFEQPVTAVQVWRTLLVTDTGSHERWGGNRVWNLAAVQMVLRDQVAK